jgi:hypothetical protein
MATGTVASIDTIASLRSYNGESPGAGAINTFEVQGYHSPGDGGGGAFSYRKSDTTSATMA